MIPTGIYSIKIEYAAIVYTGNTIRHLTYDH